jgi:hypothetical protein
MRYKLSDNYIARYSVLVRWKWFFIGVASLIITVVAHQQYFLYASVFGFATVVFAGVASFLLWTQLRRTTQKAGCVWFELSENSLIYGYEAGQTQIYLNNIKRVDLSEQAWPVLTLTLMDGSRIGFQGIEGIEQFTTAIKQACLTDTLFSRSTFGVC